MRWIRDLSLKYKLPFLYTTTLLVLCVSFYLIIFSLLENEMREVIERELNVNTNQIYSMIKVAADSSVRNELRSITRVNHGYVEHFYNKYKSGEISEEQAKEEAWALLYSQQIGTSGYFYILDSSGVLTHHPVADLIDQDISDYEFAQIQMTLEEQYIQYDWKNPEDEKARAKALYMKYFEPWDWVISASSYRSEFNELIQIEDFEEELNKLKFGKSGYSFVMDGEGNTLVHPFSKGDKLQNLGFGHGEALYNDIINTKNGVFTYMWSNSEGEPHREKIAVIKHFPQYDWYLASSGYMDELYEPVKNVKTILVVGFVLLLVVGASLTQIVSRTVYKPVIELADTVHQASDGDLTIQLEWDRNDEFGLLGKAFNEFVDRLESYRTSTEVLIHEKESALDQVQDLNDNLEELVDQRTKELHDSISQLKKTQRQLMNTEKLSTAGQVVTGMAHRMNTPLGTAITMSSFLSKELERSIKLYEDGKLKDEDLFSAVQSVETGLKMMEKNLMKSADLIEIMKSIAGMGRKGDASEFKLKEIFDDCLSLFPNQNNLENFPIHIVCEEELALVTSRNALMQVFTNLISNSFKHGFESREHGCINITAHDNHSKIDILYTDDGVGIEPEFLDNVFNPFGRFDTIAKGAGLGLYIVHTAVVNGLNGEIDCDSSLGHGTRFKISIPKQNF